jgi:hypothetical protein
MPQFNTYPALHLRGPQEAMDRSQAYRQRNMLLRQQQEDAQRRNALTDMEIEREGRVNSLLQNPKATAEEFARAGRSDVANAITNAQQTTNEQEMQKLGSFERIAALSRRLLQIQDPAQRRYAAKQFLASPVIQREFGNIGVDLAQTDFDGTDDATLQQGLERWAAFGQEQPQLETIGDLEDPSEGVYQKDPRTGEIKQVRAPQKSDAVTPYQQQQLALQRDQLEFQKSGGVSAEKPPAGFRRTADGNLEFIPGGPADPKTATSQRNLRPIPASAAKGIIENRANLKKIDSAIVAAQQNPDAFGLHNTLVPDFILQRKEGKGYKGGVDARAKSADIGSLLIHDRSGTAVTAAEFPRLKPFVPQAGDDPDVVVTKLQNLKANLESMQEEIESFYTPDAGYRPLQQPPLTRTSQGAQPPTAGPVRMSTPEEAMALPPGTVFLTPDGRQKVR